MSGSPSASRVSYAKPWLSFSDQVAQLESRGLVISDRANAEEFLAHINYYRFSGYCLAFESARDAFCDGVTFEQICETYQFDLVMRDLVTEALEALEVDARATFAYIFGQSHGAFGHAKATAFHPSFQHADWTEKIHEEAARSSEPFIGHFKSTYSEFPDLPIWMAMEVMSFGALSKMYKGMLKDDRKAIADRYGFNPAHLETILHHLVYVRNLCAHHSRLWDKVYSIRPTLPPGKSWTCPLLPSNDRLFVTLLLLHRLMKQSGALASFVSEWRKRLHGHIKSPPAVRYPLPFMGMPDKWVGHPEWE